MSRWKTLSFGLLLLCSATLAKAQREYEITPFVGSRFGGNIDLSQQGNSNVDYLKIKSSVNYGVMAGVTFWQNFEGEFMWNRQPTSLSSHNPTDGSYTFVSNMNFDMYQFDVLYSFLSPERKLRPFVVAGLGFSHYGVQPVNGQSVLGFSNRFAYNLGGGVKYFSTATGDYERRSGGRRRILLRARVCIATLSLVIARQRQQPIARNKARLTPG